MWNENKGSNENKLFKFSKKALVVMGISFTFMLFIIMRLHQRVYSETLQFPTIVYLKYDKNIEMSDKRIDGCY